MATCCCPQSIVLPCLDVSPLGITNLYVVAIVSLLLPHVVPAKVLKILFLPSSCLDNSSACLPNFRELSRTIARIFGFGTVGIETPRMLMSN